MAQGLLEVIGTIDLNQFWPTGESDADTTKIVLKTAADSFRFRPHPGAPLRVTRAFETATVVGRVRKRPIDDKGRVTVRLQGIDAPELHYQATAALKPRDRTAEQAGLFQQWNQRYRQHLAETGAVKNARLLMKARRNPLPCRVVTAVDRPDEVFDTYARLVGDVLVEIEGTEKNMNAWLVKHGWAFPAFYSSMADSEIAALMVASRKARKHDTGIWPYLSKRVTEFDWSLRYRGKGVPFDPAADVGPVIFPKLFRRLTAWSVNHRAKMLNVDFFEYMAGHPDYCFWTEEFLAQGVTASEPHALAEFMDPRGFFKLRPEDLVFQEAPSKLVGAGGAAVEW